MSILIVGEGRHGKDTVADILRKKGYTFRGSSEVMCQELYPLLSDWFSSPEELYEKRHNHRQLLYELICAYNIDDPTRLAKKVLEDSHGYVGMRSWREVDYSLKNGLFQDVIWVQNDRVKEKDQTMKFDINTLLFCVEEFKLMVSIHVIKNNGTIKELKNQVNNIKLMTKL
jgi:dephospho-CoA kinase